MSQDSRPSVEEIVAARERIGKHIVETPCARSYFFGDLVEGRLHLKLENLQRTGSFKDRGALNRLFDLSEEERRRGVVTASAGNHGQALAWHARRLGIPATVVMPETAPLVKVANTIEFGATVIHHGTVLDDAAVEAHRLEEEGLVFVPAFDDLSVIAGQGTIGLEIAEQVPGLSTVVVPVGGGGLISGVAIALKSLKPDVRVIGVEAAAAASACASREAGEIVKIASAETIADGIATKRVGDLTFPLIQEWVDELVVVSEEEIASAILLLLERQKTVAEGAGAAGLAALVHRDLGIDESESVVMVLSGGNIDVNRVSRIIDRGLVVDGRLVRLTVRMPDRPGSIARLSRCVADRGANVLEIRHRRAFADISVGEVEIVMHIETKGRDHARDIIGTLEKLGLDVTPHV